MDAYKQRAKWKTHTHPNSVKSYDFVLRYTTTSTVYAPTQTFHSSITLRFSFVSSSDRFVISPFLCHHYVPNVNLTVNSYARHSYVERIHVGTNETREARSRVKAASLTSSSISLDFSSPQFTGHWPKNIFFFWQLHKRKLKKKKNEKEMKRKKIKKFGHLGLVLFLVHWKSKKENQPFDGREQFDKRKTCGKKLIPKKKNKKEVLFCKF